MVGCSRRQPKYRVYGPDRSFGVKRGLKLSRVYKARIRHGSNDATFSSSRLNLLVGGQIQHSGTALWHQLQIKQTAHYLLNPSKAPEGWNRAYIHTGLLVIAL